MRLVQVGIIVVAAIAAVGCSLPAQNYRPSASNIQSLQDVPGKPLAVGEFSAQDGNEGKVNSFSMRGSSLISPYGSFAKYIEQALAQELKEAGRLDPASTVKVSGVLMENAVDASGFSTATADIAVRFTVMDKGAVRYEKVHRAHHEWPSSFAGAVALPAVQQNYHGVVQKLLQNLFSDREFAAAIK